MTDLAIAAAIEPIIDEIITRHHRYIRDTWPDIDTQLSTLADRHGDQHPELVVVAAVFDQLVDDLVLHLHTEEVMLFPHVRYLARGAAPGVVAPFGTVLNPIRMLQQEHERSLEALAQLRGLTTGYTPPPGASHEWRAAYLGLAAFDRDLRRHIALENDRLFPAAVDLEVA